MPFNNIYGQVLRIIIYFCLFYFILFYIFIFYMFIYFILFFYLLSSDEVCNSTALLPDENEEVWWPEIISC